MTSSPENPSRHCAVEFQALPSRIGQVRRIVTAQLRYWGVPHLTDRAALGLTELLANIHRHAGADKHCTVELVLLRDRLTVSVHDHDPHLPQVRSPGGMATSGRGLALVQAVSADWGMRLRADHSGKSVWFTLPADGRPAEPREGPHRAPVPAAAAPRRQHRAGRMRGGAGTTSTSRAGQPA
ncbi:ATP-binding protein [Streptomyces aidingensis]|uniref:Anti-sigma regulatory factor (Ser/Thr protein kinase) n=1 Tax=Streptomyces aidingensis TaxID=910347 RepID=A0A1I1PLM8_9ACTN|nr:ATP-binding protein [Streptomyces aidingensis]SFD07873.1 Anti-sigma regulatory factor (Ser/Thr protein kinase) [Streptomyces aidingensis]